MVCFPGIGYQGEGRENHGSEQGRIYLVQVGTNDAEREGTSAIVREYKHLARTLKKTWVEQLILSGIGPGLDAVVGANLLITTIYLN